MCGRYTIAADKALEARFQAYALPPACSPPAIMPRRRRGCPRS